MSKGINEYIVNATTNPTKIPRVIPPSAKANVNSISERGGIKMSTILPCTFDIRIDEEVLAKAFCKIDIQTKPGARNSAKSTLLISITLLPRATANII